ncbi:MAG: hypothetical protein ABL880_10035 [Methylotenera sp.]
MKKIISYCLIMSFGALVGCATDKHTYASQPQKIFDAVNAKYPAEKNTLVFIDAPEGFIAPRLANCEVEKGVNTGKVVAISSALSLKTSTVVVAGENESLTATTLAKALMLDKEKISGSKAIVIGAKETQKTLTDLAAASGVTLEFVDNPN